MPSPVTCPVCASPSVHGQLARKASLAGGMLTQMLTGDATAGLMASQMGEQVVHAFCLSCGAQWAPGTAGEHYLRAVNGQLGEEAKQKALLPPGTKFNCVGCGAGRPYEGSEVIDGVRYCVTCQGKRR